MSRYTSLVRRLGHQRWFAFLGARAAGLDRWLLKRTRGRVSAIGPHGLPSLLITTTGRKSGQPRTQPLLYARDGDAYVVVGSNWGQQHHPAWSGNLLAHPDATIEIGGRQIPVHAHLATGAERERLWALVRQMWPAYDSYAERAADRDIRVFRLVAR